MANINGNNLNNLLAGTNLADLINALEGDDTVKAGGGNDTVNGGIGNDWLYGENGNDTLNGDTGNDYLDGGAGDDSLLGGDDNDTLLGGSNSDTLNGGTGNDSLDGGSHNDSLTDTSGNDTLIGGSGDDVILAGTGNNLIDGGSDNDNINAGGGSDTVTGGTGNDTVLAGAGDTDGDTIDGGGGNDNVFAGEGNDSIDGGTGNDVLTGNLGNDTINGGTGGDTINGDVVDPNAGVNLVVNGSFEDPNVASGGFGLFDSINGWTRVGAPQIEIQDNYPGLGGAAQGDQHVELDSTANSSFYQDIQTEAGAVYQLDFAYSGRAGEPISDNGVNVTWNGVSVAAGSGFPVEWHYAHEILTLTVTGTGGLDRLQFDSLGTNDGYGAFLDDVTLFKTGVGGDDVINGGTGNDTMTGGFGNDVFVFGATDNKDVITDFNLSGDDIVRITGNPAGTFAANIDPFLAQDGADALLTLSAGNTIRFLNTDESSLTAADFEFV